MREKSACERRCGRVRGGIEPVDEKEPSCGLNDGGIAPGAPLSARALVTGPGKPSQLPELPGPLRSAVSAAVALCLAMSIVHVLMVFLHVAPPNQISQRYNKQINAWIYPLFEQNWRLFAPDPEAVNRQISARTRRVLSDGTSRVSGWFDMTAVDDSAIRHSVFPSHTAQNMLRRAWTAYVETHGADDRSGSERALMMQEYLRNIAVERVATHRGKAFDAIQLRVITRPVAPAAVRSPPPGPVGTRYLPWWKVAQNGN